ncbi:MAG TPA: hypothetical protein VN797_01590, partial [Gemmatimonadaceae bacterium]|nr:hypothetical protein [Gemmatimonadaceae bacterium]
LDAVEHPVIEPGSLAKNEGVRGYAAHMSAGGLVVGIDRVEERLHGGSAQSLGPTPERVFTGDEPGRRGSD